VQLGTKREVFEETGLTIRQINPLVFTRSYIIEDGGYKGFTYISIFSINKKKKGKPLFLLM
jgi:8-oxo-dGTP pyrophosphatase MutT (NUDIX family)